MTRIALVVVPVVCALVAVLATRTAAPVALIVGGLAGLGAAGVLWALERRRIILLARTVNDWVGRDQHEPVELSGGPAWQQLAVSLNAIGAAHARRGAHLDRAGELRGRLIDAVPDPVFLFDEDGHLADLNDLARQRLDVPDAGPRTAAQTLGSPVLAEAVAEAQGSGRTVTLDVAVGDQEVSAVVSPIDGRVLVILRDRSEREHVDAVRRDFVANASHELKTPVAGIQALTEALEVTVDRDPARAQLLVARLEAEAQRLGHLVRDLLDLSRLEEGRPASGRTAVDLADLVRDEAARAERRACERAVTVALDLPDRAVLAGAEDDLRLIVGNLLDNAVVYNRPGGRVDVALQRLDGRWRLRVSDTGIGIARRDLDRIFERFYRVDVDRSRATGGTGLGLALVRHAVERHGGRVTVDSILGEGTTFTVLLPVEPAA